MIFPVSGWFVAFTLTLVVELPVVLLLLRRADITPGRLAVLVVIANLATHPAVWFVFTQLLDQGTPEYTLVVEAWAVAVEAVCCWVAVRGLRRRRPWVSPSRRTGPRGWSADRAAPCPPNPQWRGHPSADPSATGMPKGPLAPSRSSHSRSRSPSGREPAVDGLMRAGRVELPALGASPPDGGATGAVGGGIVQGGSGRGTASQEAILLRKAAHRDTSPAFMGRRAELERFDVAWELANRGEPQVLLVGAEAGMGKTRLVAEYLARCPGERMTAAGGCVPVAGGSLPGSMTDD